MQTLGRGTAGARVCSVSSAWQGGKQGGEKEKPRGAVQFSLPTVDG